MVVLFEQFRLRPRVLEGHALNMTEHRPAVKASTSLVRPSCMARYLKATVEHVVDDAVIPIGTVRRFPSPIGSEHMWDQDVKEVLATGFWVEIGSVNDVTDAGPDR